MPRAVRVYLAIIAVLAASPAYAQLPEPDGYVADGAGVLEAGDEEYLENYLATLERETGAELAVATVTTLDGMSIEEYAVRLFETWGVGQREKDNGVLLLVAPAQREVRIEVGYGLEAILPDGLAGDIIRTVIVPEFAAGNMRRGVGRGVDRIAAVIRRDPSAMPSTSSSDVNGGWWWLFILPPVVMLVATIVAVVMRVRRGPVPGAAGAATTDSSSSDSSSDSGGSSSSSDFGGGSSGGGGASGRW